MTKFDQYRIGKQRDLAGELYEFARSLPKVGKMEFTKEQLDILISDYGYENVKDTIRRIEAYEKRRYKHLYRTIRNWWKQKAKVGKPSTVISQISKRY